MDLVTYAAAGAVDLPAGRVFGSGTVLDSSRFRYLIARRAGVNVGNVCGPVTAETGRGGRGRAVLEVPLAVKELLGLQASAATLTGAQADLGL